MLKEELSIIGNDKNTKDIKNTQLSKNHSKVGMTPKG